MDAEDMTSSPPRLPPVSGVLVAVNPAVVRPVAFRAIHGGSNTTLLETSCHGADEGSSSNGSVFNFPEDGLLLPPPDVQHPPADNCHYSGHHSAPVLEWHQRAAQRWRTAFYPARKCNNSTPLHHQSSSLCKVFFHQSMPQFGRDADNLCKEVDRGSRSSSGSGIHMDGVLDSGHSSALLPEEALQTPPSPSDSGIAELEAQLREKDAEIMHLRQTLEQNEQAIIKVYEEKEQVWQRRMEDMKKHYEDQLAQQRLQMATEETSAVEESLWWGPHSGPWLDTSQLDNEVAELTTLMEDSGLRDDAPQLRLELRRCRHQLQLALQGFQEERERWRQAKAQAHQQQKQLETNYWHVCSQNRELLRAISQVTIPVELFDGWSESSC
ncbi:unnamed protein product [Ixodes hexagonus]